MADTKKDDAPPRGDIHGFDKPFMTPNGADGFGPTLGEDVSARRQRREDHENGARAVIEKDA